MRVIQVLKLVSPPSRNGDELVVFSGLASGNTDILTRIGYLHNTTRRERQEQCERKLKTAINDKSKQTPNKEENTDKRDSACIGESRFSLLQIQYFVRKICSLKKIKILNLSYCYFYIGQTKNINVDL